MIHREPILRAAVIDPRLMYRKIIDLVEAPVRRLDEGHEKDVDNDH